MQIEPVGSHLVCPICGLLRINHDCVAEIENQKSIKPRAKKKGKEKPWDGVPSIFFAWRSPGFDESEKKVGKQRGFKKPKAIWWGNKDADYVSVGKFKKGGAGKNRTLENLVSIDVVYSDIDAGFPLNWQELIEECEKHNIPKPNLIVRTSPNHYQLRWDIPEIDKSLLGLWELVQEGIFNLLDKFGADGQALDAIRYLRNPAKCERVYENKEKNSLAVLYRALKQAGLIQAEAKTKWPTKFSPKGIPIKESKPKLIKFFTDNPEHESTYAEISQRLSIPLRTVKYLARQFKRENRLETQVLGKGKNRKTKFIFKVHVKNSFNTLASKGLVISPAISLEKEKKELVFLFSQAWGRAKGVGLSLGIRNFAFFGFALWLSVSKKLTCEEVFRELYPVLIVTPGFSRREFEKTVKSACRDKYRYCISAKKFESVFFSLGVCGVH